MNLFRSPYKFSSLSAFWTLIYLMGGFLIVYKGRQYPLATSSSLSGLGILLQTYLCMV